MAMSVALLIASAALGKQAALTTPEISVASLLGNPWYIATLVCMGLHALIWPQVLRVLPLSLAYSIANPVSLPGILLVAYWIFGEVIKPLHLVGITVMGMGLWLLLSPKGVGGARKS